MAAQMDSIAVPNIEELFRPTHDERARQSLVSMLRKHAIIDLRAKVRSEYEGRVAPELSARGQTVKDWRDIESAMADDPVHRIYSSLRYNAQEMCYQSVQPAVERALPSMIDLARDLAARNPTQRARCAFGAWLGHG
jgi:histone H3/H4